jgi:hypothetical protein
MGSILAQLQPFCGKLVDFFDEVTEDVQTSE